MVTPRRRSRRVQKAEEIKRNTALKSPIKSPMKKKVTGKRKMKKNVKTEEKSLPRIRLKSMVGRKRKIRAGIQEPPGPRFSKLYWSWSDLVLDFSFFSVLVRSVDPWIREDDHIENVNPKRAKRKSSNSRKSRLSKKVEEEEILPEGHFEIMEFGPLYLSWISYQDGDKKVISALESRNSCHHSCRNSCIIL